jgi:Site-specific DNA methylase
VEKAARIIYLNKTCYNGLFRVNSQGQFNVPFGRYKNPNFLDDAVLRAVNKYLNSNDITLLNQDFAEAVKDAKRGDFVYFDPPYDPFRKQLLLLDMMSMALTETNKNDSKKCLTIYIKEVAR